MSQVDLSRLLELERDGWLKRREYGVYVVWDYTQKTQVQGYWTPETRMCRGLVTTDAGEIVSRPFPKFFNLGEQPLPESLGQPLVYEKVDGSLIVVSLHEGQRIVSSRASMNNSHTQAAEPLLDEWRPGGWNPLPGYTYCFELVHPDMRIVCDYGEKPMLLLLARIETATGAEDPVWAAHEWRGGNPQYFRQVSWPFDPEDHAVPNAEGFVLHWPDAHLRVKVKFAEYLRLHKLLTGVTPRTIWQMRCAGQALEPLYERVPDEFHAWVREQDDALHAQYGEVYVAALEALAGVRALPTRGEQARALSDHPYRSVVFRMLDGKEPDRLIWELVKPEPARAFWNTVERDTGKQVRRT